MLFLYSLFTTGSLLYVFQILVTSGRVSVLQELVIFTLNTHFKHMSHFNPDNREKRATCISVPFCIFFAFGYSDCKCARSREINICLGVCISHRYHVAISLILANETSARKIGHCNLLTRSSSFLLSSSG